MTDKVEVHLTAAEFIALPETTRPAELIDGVVTMSPSPTDEHQETLLALLFALRPLLPDGTLRAAPLDVVLDDGNVLQPDIFWIAPDSTCVLRDGRWYGAPDFVIEILSRSTARLDRSVKYDLYEQHGTRIYWLVDSANQTIEVYQRDDAANQFRRVGVFGIGDDIPVHDPKSAAIPVSAIFA